MKIRLTKNLDPLRASVLARLDEIMGERLHDLTASPVALLRARKAAEAERWAAGGGAGPLLRAEAAAAGIMVASLVDAILAKAANAAETVAEIEIKRQAAQAAIRSAPNPAAIDAVLGEVLNG